MGGCCRAEKYLNTLNTRRESLWTSFRASLVFRVGGVMSLRERIALWFSEGDAFAFTDKSIRDSSAAWMLQAIHRRRKETEEGGWQGGWLQKLALSQLIWRQEGGGQKHLDLQSECIATRQWCNVYFLTSRSISHLM